MRLAVRKEPVVDRAIDFVQDAKFKGVLAAEGWVFISYEMVSVSPE